MKTMESAILTIVISTYNRSKILEENIMKLLKIENNLFQIIVGDNASIDDTWLMLKRITDTRLRCKKNEKNLGISNVLLLGCDVETKYFITLNDRDYIEAEDISKLCNFLCNVENFDMASLYPHKGSRIGRCLPDNFINEFYFANHPGYLVYNTEYFKRNVKREILKKYFEINDIANLSNYTYLQLMSNLKIAYTFPISLIQQPVDRDKKIPQTRKEMFGYAYVLPEYHMEVLNSLVNYVLVSKYENRIKVGKIVMGTFDFALKKTGPEYFFSTIYSDFRKRNHINDVSPWMCFSNVRKLTNYVSGLQGIKELELEDKIKKHGNRENFLLFFRMIRHFPQTFKAIFYKYL